MFIIIEVWYFVARNDADNQCVLEYTTTTSITLLDGKFGVHICLIFGHPLHPGYPTDVWYTLIAAHCVVTGLFCPKNEISSFRTVTMHLPTYQYAQDLDECLPLGQ